MWWGLLLRLHHPAEAAGRRARGLLGTAHQQLCHFSHEAEPAANDAAAHSSSIHSLRELLSAEQLSYPALVSLLRYAAKDPLQPGVVLRHIAAIRAAFGADLMQQILQAAPQMAMRKTDTLQQHFEGLKAVLGGDEALARSVVSKDPTVLNHQPTTVADRLAALQGIFNVSPAQVLQLVAKAPALLRLRPALMAERVQYLHKASGLSCQQLFSTFLASPILASTSTKLLVHKHHALQSILRASPEEMQHICRQYPVLLSRDASFVQGMLSHIAQHVQVSEDEVAALVRSHPTLLSLNVSTLLNRITVVCQTLRLPPEARKLLLVGQHKALLTYCADLPARVEYLKNSLGLAESELLPLLHSRLTVLRLTTDQMDRKLARAASLALLNPTWAADFQALPPQQKLRILQLGTLPLWRLVFLAHTGQQHCGTFRQYLNASNTRFDTLYPDFRLWLERYNAIVSSKGIPLTPPVFDPAGSPTPATYEPVTSDHSFSKSAASSITSTPDRTQPLEAAPQHSTAASPHSSNASSSFRSPPGSAAAASTAAAAARPPSPAAVLAGWWGVEVSAVQGVLSVLQGPQTTFGLQQWQDRLAALQDCMAALGMLQGSACGSVTAPGSHLLPAVAAARAEESLRAGPSPAANQQPPEQQQVQQCRRQRQRSVSIQRQQQQSQDLDSLNLTAEARQALQHALDSGHADAVAAVSVACHVAPFSHQLQQLPPTPPHAAVQFALQHPQVVSRGPFSANCRSLAALAAESEHLRTRLQQVGVAGLAKALATHPVRLKMVQYLAQSQQPVPWRFTVEQLLLQEGLSRQGGRDSSRDVFVAAYPGYADWDAAISSI